MSVLFGSRRKDLEDRMILHEGETLVSQRKYNLTIGLVLLWGFLLNFLTMYFFGDTVTKLFREVYPLFILLLIYIVCVLIGWLFVRSKSAVLSFIGYNFVAVPIGLVLSVSLKGVDTDVIYQAVFVTAAVTAIMLVLSLLAPNFFLRMGPILFFSFFACIAVEVVCIFVFHHNPQVFDWISAVILSLYIGYDWARANKCQKTMNNAIDIATALYLDLINLFMRVVQLMNKGNASSN